jgi:hypothetical protein
MRLAKVASQLKPNHNTKRKVTYDSNKSKGKCQLFRHPKN